MGSTLTIDGQIIDRVATRTTILRGQPFVKDGYPSLTIARRLDTLDSGPDPWDAKGITLELESTLIFAGDTGSHLTHHDRHLGWVREWTCYGLAKRAEYVPVTDSVTLTDTARYNLASDDPDHVPARTG